jgi:hypothetical protein
MSTRKRRCRAILKNGGIPDILHEHLSWPYWDVKRTCSVPSVQGMFSGISPESLAIAVRTAGGADGGRRLL